MAPIASMLTISRTVLLAAFGAGLLFVEGTARAEEPRSAGRTSSLSWIRMPGAESCVPTQELARDVEFRLGRTVFVSASQADVSVEGRIDHRAAQNRWHATIILRDAKGATLGTRELDRTDASCDGMREPLVLVIAVMIDPDAALAHTPDPAPIPPIPPPVPTPAASQNAPPPSASTAAHPQRDAATNRTESFSPTATATSSKVVKEADPWWFEASAAAFGAVGMTPNPVVGVGVSTLIEAPKIPITLDGAAAFFFDSTATASSDDKPAATNFTLGYLSGGLCPLRFRGDRVHIFGCLISQLGLLRTRSEGFATGGDDKLGVLYNVGLEGRVSLRIAGPFALRAGVSSVVPLLRSPFIYERGDGSSATLFQVAPLAVTGDVGLGFEFP